ncbi:MAG: histidine kinase [Saprospiraceae bacterium]|nr:histidine kinase [Saprospiraceae bacterium]
MNRFSPFWMAQTGGWALFTFGNLALQQSVKFSFRWMVIEFMAGVTGFAATLAYRQVILWQGWKTKPPLRLIFPVLVASTLVAGIWSFCFSMIAKPSAFLLGLPDLPFYQWFFGVFFNGIILIIAWSAIYFAYHYFMNSKRNEAEKWRLQIALRDAQLGQLRAQVQPHFLFNALNNIRALVLENPQQARSMITHLSDLLRYSLTSTSYEKTTLAQEIEITGDYLALMAIQYEDRLSTRIDLPEALKPALIPPMLIQLLAENAIKHGVGKRPEGGAIDIQVCRRGNDLEIIVANPGVFSPETPNLEDRLGIGMANIHERLHLLYGDRAHFQITSGEGMVYSTVRLPLEWPASKSDT